MEKFGSMWIFAWIVAAFVGVNSDTMVYPGKSALLSYSPARGEFPVQSLFGRGYFSYIDDQGISRTVSLEPNPLLGVRVSGNGQIPADLGGSIELRKDPNGEVLKQDKLKTIKEFDQSPFEDKLEENKIPSFSTGELNKKTESSDGSLLKDAQFSPSILSVTLPTKSETVKLYPQTVSNAAESKRPSEPTLWNSSPLFTQNMVLAIPNQQPSKALGLLAFNPENPFLSQNQNHFQQLNSQAAASLPALLPGQVFIPSTVPVSSETSPPIPANPPGQAYLPPTENSEAATISPSQVPTTPTISPGAITTSTIPIADLGSSAAPPTSSTSSGGILPASNQAYPGQVLPYPSAPISFGFVSSPLSQLPSNLPLLPTQVQVIPYPSAPMNRPQVMPVAVQENKPLTPVSVLPSTGNFNSGNPFLTGSVISRPTPQQEVFMVQPGNPFLFNNNKNKDKLPSLTPAAIIPTPPKFNSDHMNPFLPKHQKVDHKLEIPTIPSIQSPPHASKLNETIAKPTVCTHDSVVLPQQIKDSPEVEQAKREHFRAHELALAQLEKAAARDNNNQRSDSSLQITSTPDSSPNDLTSNAASTQIITSGPLPTLEQTKVIGGESDGALQAFPV